MFKHLHHKHPISSYRLGGSLYGFVTKHPMLITHLLNALHAGAATAAIAGTIYGITKAVQKKNET
jgi:hypothetical protein